MNAVAQRAFVGLGSNLSEPEFQISSAFEQLARLPRTRLIACSSLYRSAPIGFGDQPDFINAAAWLETTLTPLQLLQALLDLEHRHGRERTFRNAPRILDLDLLLYDGLACVEPGLTLPHPRMHERAFVLAPLLEIAPDCLIPGRGALLPWLEACAGQQVERLGAPNRHGESLPQIMMKQRAAMTASLSPSSLPEGEKEKVSLREFPVKQALRA